jgi:hypothetical protein
VGKFSSNEASACTQCQAGYYSDSEQTTTCKACPVGKFSSIEAPACTQCEAGYYSDSKHTKSCKACPKGFFQRAMGKIDCTLCDAGKTTAGEQSIAW